MLPLLQRYFDCFVCSVNERILSLYLSKSIEESIGIAIAILFKFGIGIGIANTFFQYC